MALATRNLYLVLKARDEASRVIRGFGRELSATGRVARAETLRHQAALASQRAAYLSSIGAARAQIDGQRYLASTYRSQAAEIERAHKAAVRYANALHTVSATLITVGSTLALAGAAGIYGMYDLVKAAQEYDKQVRLTMTQTDGFKTSLEELGAIGKDVAKRIAVPFEQIQPALYDIFSSTNANVAQAKILLEGFAKTAVAGQVSLSEASRGTVPILNAFNIPLEKVNDVLDIQFQLVRKGVGTYGEFSKIFGRVVPSATRAQQNFQTVAAMLAYLTRNGLSAAMASTSAARALDALSHPKSVKAMEKLGIKVRDLKGNLLPLEDILTGLREKLLKLPVKERVGQILDIFKGAGGTIQARRFLEQVLLRPGELEEYKGFLKDMNQAGGEFGKAYGQMAGSVAAQTQLLSNKWQVLKTTAGTIITPLFLSLIGLVQKVLDWFNNLDPALQRQIVLWAGIASIMAVVGGVLLTIVGALAGIYAAVIIAGSGFFILTGAVAAFLLLLVGLTVAFVQLYKNSEGFRNFLKAVADFFIGIWGIIKNLGSAIAAFWTKYAQPALSKFAKFWETTIWPALTKLAKFVFKELMPVLQRVAKVIGEGIAMAFKIVSKAIEIIMPYLKFLFDWIERNKEALKTFISILIKIGMVVLGLVAALIAIAAIALAAVIVAVLAAVAAFVTLIAIVSAVVDWIKGLGRWFTETLPNALKTAWQAITKWWDSVVNAFVGFWVNLRDTAVAWLVTIGTRIKGFWETIKTTAVTKWNEIIDSIGNIIGGVIQFFIDTKNKVVNFFSDSWQWLVESGKKIIEGLGNGIKEGVKNLLKPGNILDNLAQNIQDTFGHSPAKRGPLKGRGGLFYSGLGMMRELLRGLQANRALITNELGGTALAVRNTVLPPQGGSSGRTFNQSITVNTQELNPRRQSMELGFLLAGEL